MTDWAKLVAVPSPHDMNSGFSPVTSSAMVAKFGVPGHSDPGCGSVTNHKLEQRIVTKWVGPFKVEGFDVAVEAMHQAFLKLKSETDWEAPDSLFKSLKTAGMLCVRQRRGSSQWSNHAWGFAVDLYCGDNVVPQGSHQTHAGLLAFYPYMHAAGFFWGGGFSGNSIDAMHFEYAAEKIQEIDF